MMMVAGDMRIYNVIAMFVDFERSPADTDSEATHQFSQSWAPLPCRLNGYKSVYPSKTPQAMSNGMAIVLAEYKTK